MVVEGHKLKNHLLESQGNPIWPPGGSAPQVEETRGKGKPSFFGCWIYEAAGRDGESLSYGHYC